MITIMLLSILISISFLFTKHPLSMGFNLLVQTIMISLITGMLNYNFWYSFILFLIMVGGMLILFIYMTSVASNEKFSFSIPMMMILSSSFLIIIMSSYLLEPTITSTEVMTSMTQQFNSQIKWNYSLSKFLSYPQNLKLIMLMSYLFLALVAIVKITSIKHGPLRIK
uniref:NADH dehydrogenase subunit 6 n=1 Tax=Agrilus sichuanus TaxID=2946725 RepID=UPI00207A90BE|nr:NADH dehydrogenase subunit 6 [Agrilus sichuanus]URN73060.1 NADH dehydrogenase subunit 6 [Agrilus sichuanus]